MIAVIEDWLLVEAVFIIGFLCQNNNSCCFKYIKIMFEFCLQTIRYRKPLNLVDKSHARLIMLQEVDANATRNASHATRS